ncbi:YetF domain-containing protein [Anaeromicropila herbilytica]|uniref:DUF421 domain-containing protein n=1 Tax=Anaeromicropila herbilytica TaxID=2785025 RepID=A0A7R7ENG2_9FIRM|nr:DUF421 domain-containing protein [Anaeromicropila herbilytica]BCN32085.1 DUF421 domain-containing protein [Anaeromicropila herbilytica]
MTVDIIYLLYRTSIIFIVLLMLARILGRKQLSQLTFFNYITGITIGSIAANMISESHKLYMDDFVGIVWWCVLTELTGYINLKSGKIRRIIDGQPTIIIKKGNIIKKALKSTRINLDDLSMLLREEGIFSIKNIDYAILEPDGKLSVLKKPEQEQPNKKDLNIQAPSFGYLPSEIISDGKIMRNNLKEYDLNEEWVMEQLKHNDIKSVKEVFYAELQEDGTLFIQK